jgi:hypothetical protein
VQALPDDAPMAEEAEGAREGGLGDRISVFPQCDAAPPHGARGSREEVRLVRLYDMFICYSFA